MAKGTDPLAAIRKRVATVTTGPGVYRWLDKEGTVMYVGKAKNLRNRMRSYVAAAAKHAPWIAIMVRQIADFEVTVTRSELECLILEMNLIKKLRPKYNILLKDDKNYVYVRVSREKFPRVDMVRQLLPDHARYFGPFLGGRSTERTLDMLDSILHFHSCKKSLDVLNKAEGEVENYPFETPCLDFQIGKCNGLCVGKVSEEEYNRRIDEIISFFRGNYAPVKKQTVEQMKQAAADQKFEKAARIRDALKFIEDLELKQIVSDTSGENSDVFGVAIRSGKVYVSLLRERDGKVIEHLDFSLSGGAETAGEVLSQFVPQYYLETADFPDILLLAEPIEDQSTLEEWLKEQHGKIVRIHVPERGKKSKLLLLAEKNAEDKARQSEASWEADTRAAQDAVTQLTAALNLPLPAKRIEGFDISHQGGEETVASMVVFENGKPKRAHYRSFNMKTVAKGDIDDYKSLQEALRRRLKYLTVDLKKEEAEWKAKGITFGKAKKSEQKLLEAIHKERPGDIGDEAIDYKDYLVGRRGKDIVTFARFFHYPEGVLLVRSVWVKQEERGNKLGQLVLRKMLKAVKKGKVYLHCKESLEPYYEEVGFRHIWDAPDALKKKLSDFETAHPEAPKTIIMMYNTVDHKADESFCSRPDLILIDGGKGQLSSVVEVFKALNVDVPVASIAKRQEEIFVPNSPIPIPIRKASAAQFLLQRVRDESHRFANDRRKRRSKVTLFQSALDELAGIGEASKQKLLKAFGSVEGIKAATDDELRAIVGEEQLKTLRAHL